MNNLDAMLKAILILSLEHKMDKRLNSVGLAEKVLEIVKSKKGIKTYNDNGLLLSLENLLETIIKDGIKDLDSIVTTLEMSLAEKPTLFKLLQKYIQTGEKQLGRKIRGLRDELLDFIVRRNSLDVVTKYKKLLEVPIGDVKKVLSELVEELANVIGKDILKNPTIINEVDFDNMESISKAIEETVESYKPGSVLKTGWGCINNMLQGGFRLGEFVVVAALQHNYKSGFVKSIFLQLVRLNKPKKRKEGKKPLAIFITYEEEMKKVLFFFYSYFKYLYDKKAISIDKDEIDAKEMEEYIRKYLLEGSEYSIKLIRQDPTMTRFHNLKKLIESYDDSEYDLQILITDYLSQINLSDLKGKGPSGVEIKELFKLVRNETSKRDILFITPHQISTEAKRLLRNGIPDLEFVKKLYGKGFYAGSAQLDQEVDLEIFLHKASLNRKPVLTYQRGKHRIDSIVDEKDMYGMLEFPRKAPIPEDHDEYTPCLKGIEEDTEFGF